MIKLETDQHTIQVAMQGTDSTILNELALSVMRMLSALEKSNGNPVSENLTYFIMTLIDAQEEIVSQN